MAGAWPPRAHYRPPGRERTRQSRVLTIGAFGGDMRKWAIASQPPVDESGRIEHGERCLGGLRNFRVSHRGGRVCQRIKW